MKMIAVFHNKGGVGKTTLLYHTAYALAEQGKKVLMMDLDPQSNLSLYGINDELLQAIWEKEEDIVNEGFPVGTNTINTTPNDLTNTPRTIHFLLKPVESGVDDYALLPPPIKLRDDLALLAGRITLSQYEGVLADRWTMSPDENVLSVRTITQFRTIARRYAHEYGFEYILVDVSPSLGLLNRSIISSCDAFFMPATPDLFSMYGVRNIGQSLTRWENTYDSFYKRLSTPLKDLFPSNYVKFLGYTIYNARGRADQDLGLARAHRDYAQKIPSEVEKWIPTEYISPNAVARIRESIGGHEVWNLHNTYPAMAQKYKCPMWLIPQQLLDDEDKLTVTSNKQRFIDTQRSYHLFADDLISRL